MAKPKIPHLDLIGKSFHKLTVIEYLGGRKYKCKCDCGNFSIIGKGNLINNHTKSCGCYMTSRIKESNSTHGLTDSSEYAIWTLIKARCTNKNSKSYKHYGGRGITICDSWINSFDTFLFDMGRRPSHLHSIDRIDNEKGYFKENCRWATKEVQANNTRRNRFIEHDGLKMTLAQWSKKIGLKAHSIHARIKRGWSIEDALTKELRNAN